jgi:hypothetical protein
MTPLETYTFALAALAPLGASLLLVTVGVWIRTIPTTVR